MIRRVGLGLFLLFSVLPVLWMLKMSLQSNDAILGGLGLLVERTRRLAGWGVLALLVAVYPANIYMAVQGVGFGGMEPDPVVLWLRLPLQFVFMAVTWWVSRPESEPTTEASV